MTEVVISARALSKTYQVYARPWHRLRELVTRRPCHQAFRALEDVSFELERGRGLAIIGENGAGKSTLLKILSGVTTPTSGEMQVKGKVASLLELGMGFHPEFSGRQNIALNAALMGLSGPEVERKMPEIIAFSELEEFIDRPVKTYSTGMAMRLGFAIAVQVEPDVLIIDEALSVGDGYFQKKCMDQIRRFIDSGRTLLFCSHAMYYISNFCQRALWLRHGRVEALGPVQEVVREYENFLTVKSGEKPERPSLASAAAKSGEALARLETVRLAGHTEPGEQVLFYPHESWELEIEWTTASPELETHLGVGINTTGEVEVFSFGSHLDGEPPFSGRRRYRARLTIPELPLLKGEFNLWVFLVDEAGLHVYDQLLLPSAFAVANTSYRFGLMEVPHRWESLDKIRRTEVLAAEAVG